MPGLVKPPPTRAEVEQNLRGLINGTLSRTEASDWAMHWIAADSAGVEDPKVWRALDQLGGADLISTDRPFLHGKCDFVAWLAELVAE